VVIASGADARPGSRQPFRGEKGSLRDLSKIVPQPSLVASKALRRVVEGGFDRGIAGNCRQKPDQGMGGWICNSLTLPTFQLREPVWTNRVVTTGKQPAGHAGNRPGATWPARDGTSREREVTVRARQGAHRQASTCARPAQIMCAAGQLFSADAGPNLAASEGENLSRVGRGQPSSITQ
jgi:hypothetical protein